MSWRDLLVFADGSANGLARAQIAGAVAARFPSCALTLCVPAIVPAHPYGPGAPALADAFDAAVHLAREDAAAAAKRASSALNEAPHTLRVISPEWRLSDAEASAAALARSCDVIMIGQPIRADQSALDDALLAGVLFGSGRPVIVAPRWDEPRPIGTRILAAWTDTREATRAIHDAMPLMTRAERVRLLHLTEAGNFNPLHQARFDAMAAHLRAHDIQDLSPQVIALDDSPPLTLTNAAEAFKADLVVMGGYSHARLRQFVFGGMTRTMLHQTKVALLLSH